MKRVTSSSGFLLVELCIGFAILVLLSGIVAFWHMRLISNQQEMVQRTRALFLACSLIEEMKAFKKVPSCPKKSDFRTTCTLQRLKELPGFGTATVSVSWNQGKSARSICLTTRVLL